MDPKSDAPRKSRKRAAQQTDVAVDCGPQSKRRKVSKATDISDVSKTPKAPTIPKTPKTPKTPKAPKTAKTAQTVATPHSTPSTQKQISIVYLGEDNKYVMYCILSDRMTVDERQWCTNLHIDSKTSGSRINETSLKLWELAQFRLNFLDPHDSTVELAALQQAYKDHHGHNYDHVGKWREYAGRRHCNVMVIRSSFPEIKDV